MTDLDCRLNAYRDDLADARLKGKLERPAYSEGREMEVACPVADLRARPRFDAGVDTQLLCGDRVRVFDEEEGWAWVQAGFDGYVGYMPAASLGAPSRPTHRVRVQRSFVYPGADLRFPHCAVHSMGAALTIVGEAETRGTRYGLLASGEAVILDHLAPLNAHETDYVTVAERFEHTPYLWGGTSGLGVDCSGLVQLAMRLCGRTVLRDTDMQAESLGTPLDIGADLAGLRRGDLVFWKGHVAIMTDARDMIHANGHTMTVAREPLAEAVTRIGYLYGGPIGFRRP